MIPERFKIHEVTIRRRLDGGGMYEDEYADPVNVMGFAQIVNHLSVGTTGEESVSELTLWLDPDVQITEGSLVTVLGKESSVLGVGIRDSIGSLSHLEVSLGFYRRGTR